jgi:hypothetical protein
LLVGERADFGSVHKEHSEHVVLPQHGDDEDGSPAMDALRLVQLILGIDQKIDDMDRLALERGPPDRRSSSGTDHIPLPVLADLGRGAIPGEDPKHLAVEASQQPPLGPGQPGRVLDEGVEHRLKVERRATDDFQDFARGCLLLERLAHSGMNLCQRPILFLKLREQAHVLNGDHGLVGKGFEERDLTIGKRLPLSPRHRNRADTTAAAEHRNGDPRTVSGDFGPAP